MAYQQDVLPRWNPPVGFYFVVDFKNLSAEIDEAFMEVSGLGVEMETEEVEEGGESRFKYRVPVRQKHGNLVCKRSIYPVDYSPLSHWVKTVVNGDFSEKIMLSDADISLLDESGNPVCSWSLTGLYPFKWDITNFNSQKNELAIETIEFVYNTIRRTL